MSGVVQIDLTDFGVGKVLNRESARAFQDALETLATQADAKVALVTGDRTYFCAGGDEAGVGDIVLNDPSAYAPFVRALAAFPLPVVAALEGSAIGAGLGLALAVGDVFVAAREGRYGAHFIRMGLTPGMGVSYWLQARCGPGLVAEMLYSGRTYRGGELAADPRAAGLFDRILPRSEVLAEAQTLAAQFAQAPRPALIELKRLLRPDSAALDSALEREGQAFRTLAADPDLKLRIADYFQLLPRQTLGPPSLPSRS